MQKKAARVITVSRYEIRSREIQDELPRLHVRNVKVEA